MSDNAAIKRLISPPINGVEIRGEREIKLACVCRELLDFIAGNADHFEPSDVISGKSIIESSREALSRANEIAGGGE